MERGGTTLARPAQGGEHVLRELRMLDRMGPLSILVTGVSSEVDGLFNGYVWQQDGQVVGNIVLSAHP